MKRWCVASIVLAVAGLALPGAAAAVEKPSFLDRVEFFGDLRARVEQFVYDEKDDNNRTRGRYRLRFGLKADINQYVDAGFRLATGSLADPTTRNESFGGGVDFNTDQFGVDLAYLTVKPWGTEGDPVFGGQTAFVFGKQSNLFRSNVGRDFIVWDGDLTPEGVSLTHSFPIIDNWDIHLDAGYWVVDENSSNKDPDIWSLQLRKSGKLGESFAVGSRFKWQRFGSLNNDFFERAWNHGNNQWEPDWLTPGAPFSGNGESGLTPGRTANVLDYRAWLKWSGLERWPILLYGNVTTNVDAQSLPNGGDKEDFAWSVGVDIGDKKECVQFGAAYFWVEANATPANFTDSDLFDGMTNQRGWNVYAQKRVFKSIDIVGEVFAGNDWIDDGIARDPTAGNALTNPKRVRWRLDVKMSF